jgi:hypothetical protein
VKRFWWRNVTIIFGLAILFYGVPLRAAGAEPLVLTKKDSGRTVTVGVGQGLVVNLQLGAGHQMVAPEFDAQVLALVGQSLQSITGSQGASSRIIYQFIVRQAGTTNLVIDVKGAGKEGGKSKPFFKIKIVASGRGKSV